jgi:hypothetical protein
MQLAIYTLADICLFIGVGFGTENWWLAIAALAAAFKLMPYEPR